MIPRMLTIQEAADRLAVSYSTVYRLLQAGELRGAKIAGCVRVFPASLVEYLEEKTLPKKDKSAKENHG